MCGFTIMMLTSAYIALKWPLRNREGQSERAPFRAQLSMPRLLGVESRARLNKNGRPLWLPICFLDFIELASLVLESVSQTGQFTILAKRLFCVVKGVLAWLSIIDGDFWPI